MKRLYKVHDGVPEEYAELIVAESEHQARVIGFHVTDLGSNHGVNMEDLDVEKVTHYSGSDKQIPQEEIDKLGFGDMHISGAPEEVAILRDLGWECDGDQRCTCCGLAELDGQFPVCDECDQCSECGGDQAPPEGQEMATGKRRGGIAYTEDGTEGNGGFEDNDA